MKLRVLLIVCAFVRVACAGDAENQDAAVARIRDRVITRSQIACRGVPADRCPEVERAKLSKLMTDLLIAEACRSAGIVVTPADITRAARKGELLPAEQFAQMTEDFRRGAAAVLQVHEGAAPDEVFKRELAPHGFSREQFDAMLRNWPTAEHARRVLRTDLALEAQTQIRAQIERRVQLERLSEAVAARASQQKIGFEQAETEFWGEVVRNSNAMVVPPYTMPNMGGLLNAR